MKTATWIAYDPLTRQLETLPDALVDQDLNVNLISWRTDIAAGASIAPGTRLANAFFDPPEIGEDPPMPQVIVCPDNCSGVIDATNGNIPYDELQNDPAMLLRLSKT